MHRLAQQQLGSTLHRTVLEPAGQHVLRVALGIPQNERVHYGGGHKLQQHLGVECRDLDGLAFGQREHHQHRRSLERILKRNSGGHSGDSDPQLPAAAKHCLPEDPL